MPVDWLQTGRFRWVLSPPVLGPEDRGGDHYYSIKDPSVVHWQGRWHLFVTVRGRRRSRQVEYIRLTDWEHPQVERREMLQVREGYFCAPQVFYFRPHRRWYLIYQVGEPDRKPGLQPAYSTTEDITEPDSWSPARLIFPEGPAGVEKWIDFWVICDSERAYLPPGGPWPTPPSGPSPPTGTSSSPKAAGPTTSATGNCSGPGPTKPSPSTPTTSASSSRGYRRRRSRAESTGRYPGGWGS